MQSSFSEAYAAVSVDFDDIILQPFVLRDGVHKDIASLYDFGGPVSNISGLNWVRFDDAFAEWRQKHGVLCEYGQLSPFLHIRQHELIKGFETTHLKNVVVVDLNRNDDVLLASFSRNRRRGIKDAMERGVIIQQSTNWEHFAQLYRQSMHRLSAADRWFYPDSVWHDYLIELGPDHCALLKAFTYDGGEEAMLLVLHAYGKAYAHFLGTNGQNSTDLLYYESMKYCRNAGAHVYHLGGGLTAEENDPLLAYKAGFSERRAPVYTYKRVFNEAAYAKACEGIPETSFFPAYRANVNGLTAHQA